MKHFQVVPALFVAGLMLTADLKPAFAQVTAGTPEVEKIQDRDREHRRRHDRPDRRHPRRDDRVVRVDRPERRDRPERPDRPERRDRTARPDRPVRR